MTSGSADIAACASKSLPCHPRSTSRSVSSRGTSPSFTRRDYRCATQNKPKPRRPDLALRRTKRSTEADLLTAFGASGLAVCASGDCTAASSRRLLKSGGAGIERELTGGPVERVDRRVSEQLTADRSQIGPLRYVLERDVARGQPPVAVGHEHGASDASAKIVPPAVPEPGVENCHRASGLQDGHSAGLLLGGVSRRRVEVTARHHFQRA